jgi:hypothetical protein
VQTMQEDIYSIHVNDTWELTELPHDMKKIGTKWFYKTKYNCDGSVERHKERLDAKGFTQRYGIDYKETFAPVARHEIVRMMISFTTHKKWSIHHMDVKSAFLNGYLEEEVFVEQTQGFEVQGKEHQVYKLKKALYGLKKAPRTWYARTNGHFQETGFNRSKSEPTLYYKQEGNGILIVSLYVDDLLYMGSSSKMKDEFKIALMNEF